MPTKAGYVSAMAGLLAIPLGAIGYVVDFVSSPAPPPPQVVTTNITNNTVYSGAPPPPAEAAFDVTEPVEPLYFYSLDATSLVEYANFRIEQSSENLLDYQIDHVGTFYLDYPTFESAVVVFNDNADGDCHGCSGNFTVFEFVKEEGRWRLKSEVLRFPTQSSWGGAAHGLKVIPISPRSFGLFFRAGYLAQGTMAGWTQLRAIQNGNLVKVLEICDYMSMQGLNLEMGFTYHFEASVGVVPKPLGMYDLEVKVSGDDNGTPINESYLVPFDGAVYDVEGLPPYLHLPCS